MLTQEAINEFKQIYFQEEGIKLSDGEAEEKANQTFDLFADLLSSTKLSNNEISTT